MLLIVFVFVGIKVRQHAAEVMTRHLASLMQRATLDTARVCSILCSLCVVTVVILRFCLNFAALCCWKLHCCSNLQVALATFHIICIGCSLFVSFAILYSNLFFLHACDVLLTCYLCFVGSSMNFMLDCALLYHLRIIVSLCAC